MVVAELFVNLGIKGSDKTVNALVGVKHQLGGLASMSLEAKAAIIGAMYALEQLFSKSGQAGTDLTNFNAVVGMSTKTLQQYQYAARQVGVSNDETASTFKNLQSLMTKTSLGTGRPSGLGQVAMTVGGMTARDVQEYMKNPEKLLLLLQKYAQKEKRLGIRDETLRSFGLGDNMIAALSRNAFKPENLQRAPVYGEGEVKALDKANIAWSNLGNKIQMAIGHLNAAHGGELVKDFSILVDLGIKFSDILLTIAERSHLFEHVGAEISAIGKAFNTMLDTLSGAGKNSAALDPLIKILQDAWTLASKLAEAFWDVGKALIAISEKFKIFENLAALIDGILKAATSLTDFATNNSGALDVVGDGGNKLAGLVGKGLANVYDSLPSGARVMSAIGDALTQASGTGGSSAKPALKLVPPVGEQASAWSPTAPAVPKSDQKTQTVNINQNLHFPHANDPKATGDSVKRAVNDAARQLSSQTQGS